MENEETPVPYVGKALCLPLVLPVLRPLQARLRVGSAEYGLCAVFAGGAAALSSDAEA